MRTGTFGTDTERAAKSLQKLQKQAVAFGKTVGVSIAAGATVAVAAFDQLVKGAADFKDLEETTGGSAEGLASLSVAASTAGISMDEVASASIKLTKSLTGVDDESKAAGAALKALGIPLEDFKKLNPEERIDALTKAFAGFKDGTEKTEVAMALFGKTGAEQLKLFKALEEQGGRTTILTQQQINDADAYADAQAKTTAEIRLYAQAAATQFLPALNDITLAAKDFIGQLIGVSKATGGLSSDNGIQSFADGAAKGFAFLVDSLDGVIRLFNIGGKSAGAFFAAVVAGVKGDFKGALEIFKAAKEDIGGILDAETFGSLLEKRIAARVSDSANRRVEDRGFTPDTQQRLNFSGAVKPAKTVKEKRDRFSFEDPAISDALKALEATDTAKLAALEKQLSALFDLQRETRGDPAVVEAIRNTRAEIEKIKELDIGTAILDPLEQTKNLFLRSEKDYEGASAALEDLIEQQKRSQTLGQAIGYTFAGAFEDFITGAGKASDAIKALANDITRLLINKFITQNIVAAVDLQFGAANQSGTVSGGSGLQARAAGGPVSKGEAYVIGERGPETFVPYTAGKVLPNGAGGATNVTVNVKGAPTPQQTTARRNSDGSLTIDMLWEQFRERMSSDVRQGGQFSSTLSSQMGVSRTPGLIR
jgi:hypothetical protein